MTGEALWLSARRYHEDFNIAALTEYADIFDFKVGRCRLTVSKPELKARLVSALESTIR
jgi:hypothetical protein